MRVRKHLQVRGQGSSSLGRYDETKGQRAWGGEKPRVRERRHVRHPLSPAAPRLLESRGRRSVSCSTPELQRPPLAKPAARRWPSATLCPHRAFSVEEQAATRPAPLSRAPRKWSRGGAGAGSGRGRRRRAAG